MEPGAHPRRSCCVAYSPPPGSRAAVEPGAHPRRSCCVAYSPPPGSRAAVEPGAHPRRSCYQSSRDAHTEPGPWSQGLILAAVAAMIACTAFSGARPKRGPGLLARAATRGTRVRRGRRASAGAEHHPPRCGGGWPGASAAQGWPEEAWGGAVWGGPAPAPRRGGPRRREWGGGPAPAPPLWAVHCTFTPQAPH